MAMAPTPAQQLMACWICVEGASIRTDLPRGSTQGGQSGAVDSTGISSLRAYAGGTWQLNPFDVDRLLISARRPPPASLHITRERKDNRIWGTRLCGDATSSAWAALGETPPALCAMHGDVVRLWSWWSSCCNVNATSGEA